jgi:hypothetical protein
LYGRGSEHDEELGADNATSPLEEMQMQLLHPRKRVTAKQWIQHVVLVVYVCVVYSEGKQISSL